MFALTSARSLSIESESLSEIQYRIVSPSHYPDVYRLLYANFHTDEPMSSCLDLTDGIRTSPVLDQFMKETLDHNLSLMAVDPVTNKLLGVCVNVADRKQDADIPLEDFLRPYQGTDMLHIMTVLQRVNEKAGSMFNQFNTDNLFDIKMITTDKMNRKSGLATDLIRRSVELARCLGFRGVKAEATSLYSKKAFLRMGFEEKAEYSYADYRTPSGQLPFLPLVNLHKCVTLVAKRI